METTCDHLTLGKARAPERLRLDGRFVALEPLSSARHGDDLFACLCGADNDAAWTYMADGPYADSEDFLAALGRKAASADPLFFALIDRARGRAAGHAALMRTETTHGVIEVGSIMFGAGLARTAASSEAIYLLAKYVFEDLGYRRLEWKCDDRNAASRSAALRFGFAFEGIFRQHMIVKGRNRDTAWFSMLDNEWPARRAAFAAWLAPENFDADGLQKAPLGRFMPSRI